MTPSPEAGTVSIPANMTVSILTVLGWLSKLDLIIAVEIDAGRRELAKEIAKMRNDLGEMSQLERFLAGSPIPPESQE